jgi:hypothetical protein
MQERLQVGGVAAVADLQVAEAHQPGDGALHPPAVAPQAFTGLDAAPGDPRVDAPAAQRPPAAWIVIALIGVQSGRAPARPTGPARGPMIAGIASTSGSSSSESWVLAAESATAKGIPRPSTTR